MAPKRIDARVQNKRDSEANWLRENPVLLDGELIVVDLANGGTGKKIGDGETPYNELPLEIAVTAEEKARWDGKSDFTGSWNDLADRPFGEIPRTVLVERGSVTPDSGYTVLTHYNGACTVLWDGGTYDAVMTSSWDKGQGVDIYTVTFTAADGSLVQVKSVGTSSFVGSHSFYVFIPNTVQTLDEKYIPETIARTAYVDDALMSYEFITVEDIDSICGANIAVASRNGEVRF